MMKNKKQNPISAQKVKQGLGKMIFLSRWLQAPLYLGLICALAVYVFRFLKELVHLFSHINGFSDTEIMLGVLGLIDVVMIANLLIMVIMGGYETFVTGLGLDKQLEQPEWLDHLDAGAMKIKLSLALIGISSIHLLRTFIDPGQFSNSAIGWQVGIHVTLLVSALTMAFTNRLLLMSE